MTVENKVLTPNVRQQTIEALILINDTNFNTLKVVEEATEVNELLIKSLTKAAIAKPKLDDIIEEIGDLRLRLEIYESALGITARVKTRVENKLAFLKENLDKGNMGTTVTIIKR
jgi:NTP pyrophosphatase (non-canonical NTP hydrolase)